MKENSTFSFYRISSVLYDLHDLHEQHQYDDPVRAKSIKVCLVLLSSKY